MRCRIGFMTIRMNSPVGRSRLTTGPHDPERSQESSAGASAKRPRANPPAATAAASSPQPNALVGRQVVFVAGLHIESGVPVVLSARGADHAERRRRMRVRQHLRTDGGIAIFGSP